MLINFIWAILQVSIRVGDAVHTRLVWLPRGTGWGPPRPLDRVRQEISDIDRRIVTTRIPVLLATAQVRVDSTTPISSALGKQSRYWTFVAVCD